MHLFGMLQVALLLTGVLCCTSPVALAQDAAQDTAKKDGTIAGKVTDGGGTAVEGAAVVVLHLNTGDASDALSDATGNFRISGLDRGKYEVYVWSRGYRPYASSALRVERSRPVQVLVRLKSEN